MDWICMALFKTPKAPDTILVVVNYDSSHWQKHGCRSAPTTPPTTASNIQQSYTFTRGKVGEVSCPRTQLTRQESNRPSKHRPTRSTTWVMVTTSQENEMCIFLSCYSLVIFIYWPFYFGLLLFTELVQEMTGNVLRGGQRAPGRDLNPGLLQWGQSLCTRDARSTNWAKERIKQFP